MRSPLLILALTVVVAHAQVRMVNFLGFQDYVDPDFDFDYHDKSTDTVHATESSKGENYHSSVTPHITVETSHASVETSHASVETFHASAETSPVTNPTDVTANHSQVTSTALSSTTANHSTTSSSADKTTHTELTTTASDIPTTTLPDTPTENPLPTWTVDTTLPETTTIPTTKAPLPFVAAFNTSCIAGATIYVGADTEDRSDMIFYPPPDSMVSGSCSDDLDIINLNTTWEAPEYNNVIKTIYLSLLFARTAPNAYRLSKLIFLVPDQNDDYEKYYTDDIPYVLDVPIGQSYQCNGTTYMQLKHLNESRPALNFTFRDIWIEAFRQDRYQPLGPPVHCLDTNNGGYVVIIVVVVFLSLGAVLLLIVLCKLCIHGGIAQRLCQPCQDYDVLENNQEATTSNREMEQAERQLVADLRSHPVQYAERNEVDNDGKVASKLKKKPERRNSKEMDEIRETGAGSLDEADAPDSQIASARTTLLGSSVTGGMVESLAEVDKTIEGIEKSVSESEKRARVIQEQVEREFEQAAKKIMGEVKEAIKEQKAGEDQATEQKVEQEDGKDQIKEQKNGQNGSDETKDHKQEQKSSDETKDHKQEQNSSDETKGYKQEQKGSDDQAKDQQGSDDDQAQERRRRFKEERSEGTEHVDSKEEPIKEANP